MITKEQLLERYFDLHDGIEDWDEYYPKDMIHIQYRGDTVDCVEMRSFEKSQYSGRPCLFVNSDREYTWFWDEVDMKDIAVYQLQCIDL